MRFSKKNYPILDKLKSRESFFMFQEPGLTERAHEMDGGVKVMGSLDNWFMNHIQTCLSIITFKQFAEIETKEIGGRDYPKRMKIGGEKYLNESDRQINVLDSRWFTESVRGEGFAVSGHFRLQAYGEGRRERKLIYIDDFVKEGYTRKAKIEMR